jgi:hypothetical protein
MIYPIACGLCCSVLYLSSIVQASPRDSLHSHLHVESFLLLPNHFLKTLLHSLYSFSTFIKIIFLLFYFNLFFLSPHIFLFISSDHLSQQNSFLLSSTILLLCRPLTQRPHLTTLLIVTSSSHQTHAHLPKSTQNHPNSNTHSDNPPLVEIQPTPKTSYENFAFVLFRSIRSLL